MPDSETPTRKIQVANARPEDSGRGLAHLPRALMATLGIGEGDVIEILGKQNTPARAVGPYPEDEGLEIARPDPGIGTLQPVQPDQFQPFVFRIGEHGARRGGALAHDLDGIALGEPQRRHGGAREPGEAAAAVFRPGIGDLQPPVDDRLAVRHSVAPIRS